MNNASYENNIKKIQVLKSKKKYEEGIDLCNELLKKHPEAWGGYREKADILCLQGKFLEAMNARQKLAELKTEEPADYYDLARLALKIGDNKNCIKWADFCLFYSKTHETTYYSQAAFFYKAIALKNLGNFVDVLKACEHLDDGYGTYIRGDGFVTKEDLMKVCSK